MKKNFHPDYHKITVVLVNGEKREMYSTYGKEGDTIHLDIDNTIHPAWTGQRRVFEKGGQVDRFKDRYGNLGF
jgi:large subunit ribosomal protein L31